MYYIADYSLITPPADNEPPICNECGDYMLNDGYWDYPDSLIEEILSTHVCDDYDVEPNDNLESWIIDDGIPTSNDDHEIALMELHNSN